MDFRTRGPREGCLRTHPGVTRTGYTPVVLGLPRTPPRLRGQRPVSRPEPNKTQGFRGSVDTGTGRDDTRSTTHKDRAGRRRGGDDQWTGGRDPTASGTAERGRGVTEKTPWETATDGRGFPCRRYTVCLHGTSRTTRATLVWSRTASGRIEEPSHDRTLNPDGRTGPVAPTTGNPVRRRQVTHDRPRPGPPRLLGD